MIFVFIFAILVFPLYAQDYFSSDGLGMKGQAVSTIEAAPWVLALEDDDIKRLYKDGMEYKRWEYSRSSDGFLIEEYYYKGTLRTSSQYNNSGKLHIESLYDTSGDFLVSHQYNYNQKGLLIGIENWDEDNNLLSSEEIIYRSDGSLKGLIPENGDRLDWRASYFSEHYLDSHFLQSGTSNTSYQFRENQLDRIRQQKDNKDTDLTEFIYNDEGLLIKEIWQNLESEKRKIYYFDDLGNVLVENSYNQGTFFSSVIQEFNEDLLISRKEITKEFRKQWIYKYENEELSISSYYLNGRLVKENVYTEEGVLETLYRNGNPVFTKLKEQDE